MTYPNPPRPPRSAPNRQPPQSQARQAKVGSRHAYWIYAIVGLQLIGILIILILVGWFVIRRRIAPSLPRTPAVQVISTTQAPVKTIQPQIYTCTALHGVVSDKTFYSASAQDTVPYRVYLPPCYSQTNRRYPYVILLHGAGSDETEWTDTLGVNQVLDQGIVAGRLPPMLLIMPRGSLLEYYNNFTDGQSFESFILADLIPEVEKNYCTWNAPAGRDLAGISRGGFWTFEIGFRHPDVFGALAGHSPYFDQTSAPPENNPLDLEQTVTFSPNAVPRIWLDAAADDDATRQYLDVFAQGLSARQINPGYTVYPTGEHVAAYWQAHLGQYLTFYGQNWPTNLSKLMVCKAAG